MIIEYPVFSIPEKREIEKKINNFVKNEMLVSLFGEDKIDSFNDMVRNFFGEYRQFKTDVPDSYQERYIERSGTVKFYNDDFVSLTFSEYAYLGGVHPNNYTLFNVLDLNSGNKITPEDILIEGYKPILDKIAEEEFRKLKELGEHKNLDEVGFWFDDDKFSVNNNFTIGKYGLTFFYNSYGITAYAYGPTELFISYKSIKKLIKPDGLLEGLSEN